MFASELFRLIGRWPGKMASNSPLFLSHCAAVSENFISNLINVTLIMYDSIFLLRTEGS